MTDEENSVVSPRRFGLSFAAGLATLSAILLWRGRPIGRYTLVVAFSIATLAMVAPGFLAPLERVLARIFRAVSATITYVVLTLMYYLVITPLGLVIRLLGQDLLEMKFDPQSKSYWKDVESSGPGSRPDRPF